MFEKTIEAHLTSTDKKIVEVLRNELYSSPPLDTQTITQKVGLQRMATHRSLSKLVSYGLIWKCGSSRNQTFKWNCYVTLLDSTKTPIHFVINGDLEKFEETKIASEHVCIYLITFMGYLCNKMNIRKRKDRGEMGGNVPSFSKTITISVGWDEFIWKAMAEHLCQVIEKARGMRYQKRAAKWWIHFRLLHEQDGYSVIHLGEVLVWYGQQWIQGRKTLPVECFSGEMFRKCFKWIETWHKDECPSTESTSVHIRKAIDLAVTHTDFLERRIPEYQVVGLLNDVEKWMISMWKRLRLLVESISLPDGSPYGWVFVEGVQPAILEGLFDTKALGCTIEDLYLRYLVEVTQGWRHWKKDLNVFYPGEKYFWEFLNQRCRERWGRWLNSRERRWLEGGF